MIKYGDVKCVDEYFFFVIEIIVKKKDNLVEDNMVN